MNSFLWVFGVQAILWLQSTRSYLTTASAFFQKASSWVTLFLFTLQHRNLVVMSSFQQILQVPIKGKDERVH